MLSSRTVSGWLLLGLLGGALAQGCGSSSGPKKPTGSGATSGNAGKDGGSMVVEPPGSSGSGGESPYDPSCGILETRGCVPDLEENPLCKPSGTGGSAGRGATPGSGGSGTGGSGGKPSGSGGRGVGEGGASAGDDAGASLGGVGASAGESSAGGGGVPGGGQGGEAPGGAGQANLGGAGAGASGEGGAPMTPATGGKSGSAGRAAGGAPQSAGGSGAVVASVSCQVIENPKHEGEPLATCMPAGAGRDSAPCFSGADCAPGFACVGEGPGQCLAYCCAGSAECAANAHCAMQGLVPDAKTGRSLSAPVCTPAVKCSLAEPYPCGTNITCSCPQDSACVVVSNDGTTSCVPARELPPKGKGLDGQPCPCNWGYVCSQTTSQTRACVRLCEVLAHDDTCPRCQASTNLPEGWGTCIGEAPKDAGAP